MTIPQPYQRGNSDDCNSICYHEKKQQKKTEKIFIMILNVKLKCVGIDFWAFSDMTNDNLILDINNRYFHKNEQKKKKKKKKFRTLLCGISKNFERFVLDRDK